MDREEQGYTLSWIANATGFDRRTIAYYVQEGLLPRVGRRGRATRYPRAFLDRLLLIRRVRDLQDTGRLRAVTLGEIRDVLDGLAEEELRALAEEGVEEERLRALFAEPDLDTSGMAVAAEHVAKLELSSPLDEIDAPPAARAAEPAKAKGFIGASRRRDRLAAMLDQETPRVARSPGSRPPRATRMEMQQAVQDDARTRELLSEIERRARRARAGRGEGTTREQVIRVPISEAIYLAVRDIGEEDAELVEELAGVLRGKLEE